MLDTVKVRARHLNGSSVIYFGTSIKLGGLKVTDLKIMAKIYTARNTGRDR